MIIVIQSHIVSFLLWFTMIIDALPPGTPPRASRIRRRGTIQARPENQALRSTLLTSEAKGARL